MKTLLAMMSIAALSLIVTFKIQLQQFSGTTIHLAGDSTMSIQPESKRPGTGWGEPLTSMLCDGVRVINHAKNGSSTKSFLSEDLWKNLLAQLQIGDIVMIQFGHNDQKIVDPELYTDPWQDYEKHLQRFVLEVRAHAANPVLLTSIIRRVFDSQGKLENTLGDYPLATQVVAENMKVDLIDLNTATHEFFENKGPTASKKYFLHLAPGIHDNYSEGIQDDTHLNTKGAFEVASLVAVEVEKIFPGSICR